MFEFDEDRAIKINVDRYSWQWIPDRWEGDAPTGNRKTVHPDNRTEEEKAASHKRWALTEEEIEERKEYYKKFMQFLNENSERIW
jgi:hypothetical protein